MMFCNSRLSSGCYRTGTESSNPLRSTIEKSRRRYRAPAIPILFPKRRPFDIAAETYSSDFSGGFEIREPKDDQKRHHTCLTGACRECHKLVGRMPGSR